jgi:hypothetical protein
MELSKRRASQYSKPKRYYRALHNGKRKGFVRNSWAKSAPLHAEQVIVLLAFFDINDLDLLTGENGKVDVRLKFPR